MPILSPAKKALIQNLTNMVENQFGKGYFITEKDIADKYKVDIDEVILAEKNAIPYEFDDKDANSRRRRILKNLFEKGLRYYEEYGSSKTDFTDALIINEFGKLLMLKRTSTEEIEPDKWCLPGGHVEKFVSIERNLLKEVKEETGLSVVESTLVSVKKLSDGKKIYYYYCTIPKNAEVTLDNKEHSNYKFFSLTELKELPAEKYIFDLKEYLLNMLEAK